MYGVLKGCISALLRGFGFHKWLEGFRAYKGLQVLSGG